MAILKVQFNDEIRRVTIEEDCTISELTSKIRYMFPQLRNFVMSYLNSGDWVDIKSNEDLLTGVALAKKSVPPVFRVCIKVADDVALPQELEFTTPSPVEDKTESTPEVAPTATNTETTTSNTDSSTTSSSTPATITIPTPTPEQCCYCKSQTIAYRCINCYNLAICEPCESQKLHNAAHLLVKLTVPIEQLPLKQQLIFTQHIEGPESCDRTAAKAQSKDLRRAIREASLRRKEQRARKERAQRRVTMHKTSKSSKKSTSSSAAVVDVLPLIPCETAVVAVAPVVVEEKIEEVLAPVAPLDPAPQKAVEDFSIESRLSVLDDFLDINPTPLDEFLAALDTITAPALQPDQAENKQVEAEPKEEETVTVVTSIVEEEIELPQEDEESSDEDEEVVEQDDAEGSWNLMGLLGSWRSGNNSSVNVNDYRIQGIAFQSKLDKLEAMGFTDRNRNMILLAKNLLNLERTVEDLTC